MSRESISSQNGTENYILNDKIKYNILLSNITKIELNVIECSNLLKNIKTEPKVRQNKLRSI